MEDSRKALQRINAPCKGCVPPKRNETCHGICQAYLDWRAQRDELLKEKTKNVKLNDVYLDIVYSNDRKSHKRKKR